MSSISDEPRAKGLAAPATAAVAVDWGTAYELVLGLRMFVDRRGSGLLCGRRRVVRAHARRARHRDAARRSSATRAGTRSSSATCSRSPRRRRHRATALPSSRRSQRRSPRDLRRLLLGHRLETYRGRRLAGDHRSAPRTVTPAPRASSSTAAPTGSAQRTSTSSPAARMTSRALSRPPAEAGTTPSSIRTSADRPGAEAKRPGGPRPRRAAYPPEDLVDTLTRGIRYAPEPGIDRILLVPHVVSRPWSIFTEAGAHEDRLLRRRGDARHGRRAAGPARRRVQGARRRDAPAHPAPARRGAGVAPRADRDPRAREVDRARAPARPAHGWPRDRGRRPRRPATGCAARRSRRARRCSRPTSKERRNDHAVQAARTKRAPRVGARARDDDLRRRPGAGARRRRRAGASSRRSRRRAATSSTPPATTRTARASRSSASCFRRSASASSSRRSTRCRMRRDDPNAGGNQRKNMVQTLEASLRRLGTDYVDLLWLHMWDGMTPVEEVVRALDDLVSSGKVLYVGFSDTPAWVVSQAVALADLRGWARPVAVQLPYSLADRDRRARAAADGARARPRGHAVGDARGRRADREVPRGGRRAAALRRRRRRRRTRSRAR